MKRLGLFSGKIYEEDEVKGMNECGLCITDEQEHNTEFIEKTKVENLVKCGGCFGCPMASMML
jgi:hypothetical protein